MKPFVKWVGGKTQLLEKLNFILPEYKRIVEPFVGGGAFFINQKCENVIINDINFELMTAYKIIKYFPKNLMKKLDEYQTQNSKNFFLKIRSQNIESINDEVEIAARFIYLNKACFNGMYRVNSKGKFNVPYSYKEKLNLYEKSNILELSKYFNENNVEFFNLSFEKIFAKAKKGDLFFIDPPYDKEENKNNFTAYHKDNFGRIEQKKLFDEIEKLDKKGVKFILTNHNTNFINDLYKNYNKKIVSATRMINSDGKKRMNARESIIFNFDLSTKSDEELDFANFIDTMYETNIKISNLVDWKKIFKNEMDIDYHLNQLNFLISKNKDELTTKINELFLKDVDCFTILPILVALRKSEFKLYDLDDEPINFDFKKDITLKNIKKMIFGTGLWEIFINNKVKNIKDYYIGVEVGLDSNARKNRFGNVYSDMVENLLIKYNITYKKEILIKDIFIDKNKRVDFSFELKNKKYILEANFYNSGGSKLSAICGEYKNLDDKAKLKNYNFIWLTDGAGWKTAKKDLKEAYNQLENHFNLFRFEKWINQNLKNT